jgi:hypothetical protein
MIACLLAVCLSIVTTLSGSGSSSDGVGTEQFRICFPFCECGGQFFKEFFTTAPAPPQKRRLTLQENRPSTLNSLIRDAQLASSSALALFVDKVGCRLPILAPRSLSFKILPCSPPCHVSSAIDCHCSLSLSCEGCVEWR